MTTRTLFLFGRDLRLGDHAGLATAARYGEIVPALVLDPATAARVGKNPRRAAYYCGAVASLAAELESQGTRLVCRRGSLATAALRLAREGAATNVAWTVAYDAPTLARQRALQSALEEAGIRTFAVHDAPAIAPEETAAARSSDGGRGYRAFAPYVQVWKQLSREPVTARLRFATPALDSDSLPQPREFGIEHAAQDVSEARARTAFEGYASAPIMRYAAARNVPGGPPTSRLSSALAFGTIAARTVLALIDARAQDRFLLAEERVALDGLRRSLAERDFFLQLAWFFESAPDAVLQTRMRHFPFARSHRALTAWREGCTGFPLVDAGVRQLRATGWMHPRARLVAASFLCFDLGIDWRVGRDVWDCELEEDDLALATGNWQWVAGVGADLAQFPRIYNPHKQARAYDPLGTYARCWIPELRGRPMPQAPANSQSSSAAQLSLPFFDGEPYPQPVVDHERAARDFLRRYGEFSGTTASRIAGGFGKAEL
ncbi:MAG: DNA photolyase family protein [Candidatus Eremiobacteraeota bacterium]|nr:DNA photolyase family protein [Candidatus Eremiobacteraeota bacterium]